MSGAVPDELETVDRVRKLLRGGGVQMMQAGVLPVDVALGTVYAALDASEIFAGEGMAAIEWLRSALDVMERSVLNKTPRLHD